MMNTKVFGRLAFEFAEVSTRLHKLQSYIQDDPQFERATPKVQDQLTRQRAAMQGYAGILLERIEYELE
jgi:hypothetical protein